MHFGNGLFWGALIGASVALLYAPRRGTEIRGMIKNKAVEMKEKAGQAVQRMKERAAEMKKKGEQAEQAR